MYFFSSYHFSLFDYIYNPLGSAAFKMASKYQAKSHYLLQLPLMFYYCYSCSEVSSQMELGKESHIYSLQIGLNYGAPVSGSMQLYKQLSKSVLVLQLLYSSAVIDVQIKNSKKLVLSYLCLLQLVDSQLHSLFLVLWGICLSDQGYQSIKSLYLDQIQLLQYSQLCSP